MFESFANLIISNVFNISLETQLGESLQFFIADTLKIYVLILLVVSVIAFLRTFFPPHKIKQALTKQGFGTGNVIAAMLGAISPFCSCSSIPLFIGFLEAEIPLGIAFSFIITSPLVNEVAFVIMGGTFGWEIAIIYAISGIILGTIGGLIIGKLGLTKEIILKFDNKKRKEKILPTSLKGKAHFSIREAISIFKKLWWIIAIGVAIGAIIHGYIPANIFEKYLGTQSFLAVPLATLIGIPIYASSSTVVPIAFALTTKGIPIGTALAFMMSTAGLSLPEAIILKRVLSTKLLLIFFGMVAVGIMVIGYLMNISSII